MKKYLLHLSLVTITVVLVVGAEYVKIANDRGRLVDQLEEAAEGVSANPPNSPEANAALERGTLIAAGWPSHWWENQETVRSETAQLFETMIAVHRANNARSEGTAISDQTPAKH